MRRKDGSSYRIVKPLEPPFLTKSEITEFLQQFTLLGREVSIKKIAEALSLQNYAKQTRALISFAEDLKSYLGEDEKGEQGEYGISFEQYFELMMKHFERNNMNNEMVLQLAGEEGAQLSKEAIKQALEDAFGRRITHSEMGVILEQLKKDDFFGSRLQRESVAEESQTV